jgi:membrane-bound lytic murein transglycosylase D
LKAADRRGFFLRCALLGLTLVGRAYAILPLPYPLEPMESPAQGVEEELKEPKRVQGYYDLYNASQLREMELPTFENAPGTLGVNGTNIFSTPPELQERVNFWKKIYAEYTSGEAVLHDSEHPDLVYEVVDIGKYVADSSFSYRKQMRQLNRFLKSKKQAIADHLKQLHEVRNNPSAIPLDLFPIFKKFEKYTEDDKFLTASHRIRAQVGQRDRIVQGFLYGGRYFNQMMDIFAAKHMPKELTRLPLVESAFNLSARSKVGASGIWQFMRSTGKRFLKIDRAVDERNDPLAATWAAADLLRQNFEELQTWPLAITAYNHGKDGMARAVRQLSTSDLPEIIKRYHARTFGFASSNFYSEFLAILELERDYRSHFGKLMVDSPLQFSEVSLSDEVRFEKMAGACGVSDRELAVLNPSLTDWVVSGRGRIPRGFKLKVPPDKLERCKTAVHNIG